MDFDFKCWKLTFNFKKPGAYNEKLASNFSEFFRNYLITKQKKTPIK